MGTNNMLDLYTDYLISSTKYTTATGLSRLFNNRFSHDKVTRFLNSQELDNKKLWSFIKPFLRSVEKYSLFSGLEGSWSETLRFTFKGMINCFPEKLVLGLTTFPVLFTVFFYQFVLMD